MSVHFLRVAAIAQPVWHSFSSKRGAQNETCIKNLHLEDNIAAIHNYLAISGRTCIGS
jgi:hypothetical protein